jgi:hypothetical protein
MKLTDIHFYALASMTLISCMHHDNGNINISYNESGHFYSMKAHFDKSKTRDVEKYMDDWIGKRSSMSFVNTRIDGQIALEDHTTFYIRKYPGLIEIKLDKNENSDEAYQRIKSMCEGMKEVIVK